jgi:hypothetical protein
VVASLPSRPHEMGRYQDLARAGSPLALSGVAQGDEGGAEELGQVLLLAR